MICAEKLSSDTCRVVREKGLDADSAHVKYSHIMSLMLYIAAYLH